MFTKSTLESILITRHYLMSTGDTATDKAKYYNAYLLANFGIVVDKPELLTKNLVEQISVKFNLTVPKSFYTNPQDMKYFTKSELLIEQFISYFAYGSDLGRIDIFKKDLPEYVVGDELKLRTFYIINDIEAREILCNIMNTYCAYTRPFSVDELDEFLVLFNNEYYTGAEIKCKDNIFALLPVDETFARFLDKKDIVKLSIQKFGEVPDFSRFKTDSYFRSELQEIAEYIPYVKHCPMSKKQAKYFNKLLSLCCIKMPKASNMQSPDRRALKLLSEGDVVAAADIYAANGSMLERRLKMLLSRANPQEAVEIINKLPAENPIVLYQLMSTLSADEGKRTFTFYHNNKIRTHHETDYEATHRKSRLNEATRKFVADACVDRIKDYYRNLPTLGKVYVADNFYKLGMPTNTSASGKGIDVLPIGSRVPCTGDKIRTFVYWNEAFDIDSSLIIVGPNNELSTMGWFSYASKPFGNDILFSGDVTGSDGAEFFDINLNALAAKGYKYVVQTFHGYRSKLNSGEIYAGYQNKENFNTKAWDPKNIEMEFKVFGDSRACVAFAIDIQNREVIILNQILDDDGRVVRPEGFKTIEKYLQSDYLSVNIGMIAECRGEVVDNPLDADVIFDDTFTISVDTCDGTEIKSPEIIRSYELEKLVAFINN